MPGGPRDTARIRLADLPPGVRGVLGALADAGHEAALVGGCVRDLLRGTAPGDWDVATSAPPEAVAALFPGATWENPFGTVTVRTRQQPMSVEVTTYRQESGYRNHRRPEQVRWGGSLAADLARRDFTINAIAWVPTSGAMVVDPFGGRADLRAGLLRAVGDPDERLAEDALRLLRAVRFSQRFGLRIDPATAIAIRRNAPLAAGLSGERVRDELLRILAAEEAPPSAALRQMADLGLLEIVLPELDALHGVPQAKAIPGDAFDHSLRTADALPAADPFLRLVGVLHDVGKATTLADGHFIGHETVGARMVEAILRRLRFPRAQVVRGEQLVRNHMFEYRPDWTDAAVRRFVRRVGAASLPELFALRRADDVASGVEERSRGGLDELRARVGAELSMHPLQASQLAVHGDDLVAALHVRPGPVVGLLLHQLREAVLDDPTLNRRRTLIALARRWRGEEEEGAAAGDGPKPAPGARTHR
jgi:tRNA nucleotidyltransferase (CCA-adding enzyme)